MSLTLVTTSQERLRRAWSSLPGPPEDSVHQNARAQEERRCGRQERPERRATALGDLLYGGSFDHQCPFLHFFLRAFPRFLKLLHSLLHVVLRLLQVVSGLLQCFLALGRLHVLQRLLQPYLRLLQGLLHPFLQLLHVLPLRCGGRHDDYHGHQSSHN